MVFVKFYSTGSYVPRSVIRTWKVLQRL